MVIIDLLLAEGIYCDGKEAERLFTLAVSPRTEQKQFITFQRTGQTVLQRLLFIQGDNIFKQQISACIKGSEY